MVSTVTLTPIKLSGADAAWRSRVRAGICSEEGGEGVAFVLEQDEDEYGLAAAYGGGSGNDGSAGSGLKSSENCEGEAGRESLMSMMSVEKRDEPSACIEYAVSTPMSLTKDGAALFVDGATVDRVETKSDWWVVEPASDLYMGNVEMEGEEGGGAFLALMCSLRSAICAFSHSLTTLYVVGLMGWISVSTPYGRMTSEEYVAPYGS